MAITCVDNHSLYKRDFSFITNQSQPLIGGFVAFASSKTVLVTAGFIINKAGFLVISKHCAHLFASPTHKIQSIIDECIHKYFITVIDVPGLHPLSKTHMMRWENCHRLAKQNKTSCNEPFKGYHMLQDKMETTQEDISWFNETTCELSQATFPKILHQTWFGPMKNLGRHKQALMKKCKEIHEAAGWKYILWTDDNINQLYAAEGSESLVNYEWFRDVGGISKSDIARIELVFVMGGLYLDGDTECLRPFDPLHETLVQDGYECYAGLEMKDPSAFKEFSHGLVAQGTIACVPRSKSMMKYIVSLFYVNRNNAPWIASGPYQWSTVIDKYKLPVKLLPSHVFYPHHHSNGVQKNRMKQEDEVKKLIEQGSFANHHWGTTFDIWHIR